VCFKKLPELLFAAQSGSRQYRPGLVLAIGGVDAGIRQHQALDGFAANYVRVDDLVHIGGSYATIPDGIGIDDKVGSVLALVKAAGLVRAHFPLQATLGQFLLKKLL